MRAAGVPRTTLTGRWSRRCVRPAIRGRAISRVHFIPYPRPPYPLGDLAANTIVARERKPEEPDLDKIAPAKYNSLVAYPHLAARLRSLVTPEAAAIAIQAVTLRDGYDPVARIQLFAELAAYFRSLVEFPEQALEGVTDEQYVRSVLRVIYTG